MPRNMRAVRNDLLPRAAPSIIPANQRPNLDRSRGTAGDSPLFPENFGATSRRKNASMPPWKRHSGRMRRLVDRLLPSPAVAAHYRFPHLVHGTKALQIGGARRRQVVLFGRVFF